MDRRGGYREGGRERWGEGERGWKVKSCMGVEVGCTFHGDGRGGTGEDFVEGKKGGNI